MGLQYGISKKQHFAILVAEIFEENAGQARKLVVQYSLLWIILVCLGSGGAIPTYMSYSKEFMEHEESQPLFWVLFSLLIASSLTYYALWASSIVTLWIILHVNILKWKAYVKKLQQGTFRSIAQALIEHARLTEQLSKSNASFEVYLFGSLCVLIATILSSLYISLLPEYSALSIWTISFFLDCSYLLGIFIPGAVVTQQTRKVLKISNRIRAFADPNDEKNIRQLDSFLIYLQTNNASMKVAGVAIDLGFVTKLCISLFTICAFMVQRELAH